MAKAGYRLTMSFNYSFGQNGSAPADYPNMGSYPNITIP